MASLDTGPGNPLFLRLESRPLNYYAKRGRRQAGPLPVWYDWYMSGDHHLQSFLSWEVGGDAVTLTHAVPRCAGIHSSHSSVF